MIEPPGSLRLQSEPAHPVDVSGKGRRKHFDPNIAFQSGIACAVDLAHPAGADQPDNLIGSNLAFRDERLTRVILIGMSDFNLILGQHDRATDLPCQAQIALGTVGWLDFP
jgi:hypothetical protein